MIGVDRSTLASAPFQVIQADLLEDNAITRVLAEAQPEAVIHCAALADVDAASKSKPGAADECGVARTACRGLRASQDPFDPYLHRRGVRRRKDRTLY